MDAPINQTTQGEKLLALSLFVGSSMLKNGGETYRAEDCARRILSAGNADDIEVFAIPTSMLITVTFDGVTYTRSVSVKERDTNLDMIDRLNTVSRRVSHNEMTVGEAYDYIIAGKAKKTNPYLLGLYSSLSSAAFAVLFGGTLLDFVFGFFAAALTNASIKFFKKTTGYTFLSALYGSILMAVLARVICAVFPAATLSAVIIGGIMPMLPGLAMTNAVRDTINGDLVSGSSKAIEALLQAVAIAAGVSIVLAVRL